MAFDRLGDIVVHHETAGPDDAPLLVLVNSLGTDLRVWDALLPLLGRPVPHAPLRQARPRADRCHARALHHRRACRGSGARCSTPARRRQARRLRPLDRRHDRPGAGERRGPIWCAGSCSWTPPTRSARPRCGASGSRRSGPAASPASPTPSSSAGSRPTSIAHRAAELAGWRNMLTRTPVEGYLGCCAAIRDADLTATARALAVPTLCMVGDHGRLDAAGPGGRAGRPRARRASW